MTTRFAFALVGVVLAVVIPIAAFRFGLSLFWSQTLGIIVGSLPMYVAFTRQRDAVKIALPWAIAMTAATLIVLAIHRVLG